MQLVKVCRYKNISYAQLSKLLVRRFTTNPDLSVDALRKKIIYNCSLIQDDVRYLTFSQRRKQKFKALANTFLMNGDERPAGGDAICLKYLSDLGPPEEEKPAAGNEILQFPFDKAQKLVISSQEPLNITEKFDAEDLKWDSSTKTVVRELVKNKNWIPHSPEVINDAILVDGKNYNLKYGTVDPEKPVSQVSCGGCGALLHCQVRSNISLKLLNYPPVQQGISLASRF